MPDVVCLLELKSTSFPEKEISRAGYGAVWQSQKSWNGVAILARGREPIETCRGLPTGPDEQQGRYIEAAVDGILAGCVYLPNGNSAPEPKFDYKRHCFLRLKAYAAAVLELEIPAILGGDFTVMPTILDIYKPERWIDDALFRPDVRKAYFALLEQVWTDAIRHLHPTKRVYTFWKYWRNSFERDAGLRIDHFLLSPAIKPWLRSARVRWKPRSWPNTSDHAPVLVELEIPNQND
jgi:exodeoxyribonuclease-3